MTSLPRPSTKNIFLKSLQSLHGGYFELTASGQRWEFGEPGSALRATVAVHDDRFFRRAVFGGGVGLGESWMDGDWSSPDLVAVVRLAVRNLVRVDRNNRALSAFSRMFDIVRHRLRRNSVAGSRRNVEGHYDLSNDFFRLFLDRGMMYSCAYFRTGADSLETAQAQKLDRICEKRLGPQDHVLEIGTVEIGTGWGGFAEHAARHYGSRVTTTTISRQQHEYARHRFSSIPEGKRIELLSEDYRDLRGRYDKIVSIEMFEAVGLRYYDDFFRACDRLLHPDGVVLMQTITINEQAFQAYRWNIDWIQKHVFPGAELASLSEILRSLARVTSLSLYHAENIGTHYARTLAAWHQRFCAAIPAVRDLGFDGRFLRMWDYYLGYCEGAFLERHIGDFQLLLTKNHNQRILFDEPWAEEQILAACSGGMRDGARR